MIIIIIKILAWTSTYLGLIVVVSPWAVDDCRKCQRIWNKGLIILSYAAIKIF